VIPLLHIPLDFERREDVRRFTRLVGEDFALVWAIRLWTDWGTAAVEFRPLGFSQKKPDPFDAEEYQWKDDDLTYIVEEFCYGGPTKLEAPGFLIKKAIAAGMIQVVKRDGSWGLILNDFWRFNAHLSPTHKTIQQRGAIARNAIRSVAEVEELADKQVRMMSDIGKQFALPIDQKPTTEEVKRCVATIMMLDRACDRPLRKSEDYAKNEPLMTLALNVVRGYTLNEVRMVYEYLVAHRDDPRTVKLPDRILERFGELLRKTTDDLVPA
jgi:hypothetical protein